MPLTRALNRSLNRPLARHLNRALAGRSRRQHNDLAEACRLLTQHLRWRRKIAKAEPHLFGSHAGDYYRDTLRMAAARQTALAALDKIYGPDSGPGLSPDSVWVERYHLPPSKKPVHRKWFYENYPA